LRVLGKTIAFKLVGFRAGLSFPSDFLWPAKKVRHNNAPKESETTPQQKKEKKEKEKKESPPLLCS
jgi:hypothetical protein